MEKQKKGLAITSLVLGIVSYVLCLNILTGIPAIITGHIALSRSRKEPGLYGGGGLAIAGLVMGYLSLVVLLVLPAMLLPALSQAKAKAQTVMCINNLKQVGLAARMYSADHDKKFPSNFEQMASLRGATRVLICPADKKGLSSDATAGYSSYEWLGAGMTEDVDPQQVIARCPFHGSVAHADGSVEMGKGKR